MTSEAYKKGAEMMSKVYDGIVPVAEEGSARLTDLMIPTVFGSLWDESKLTIKERRLFTMGIIAAMGEHDVFQIQASAALRRGEMDAETLHELCCQAAFYSGFPRVGGLLNAVAKATEATKSA